MNCPSDGILRASIDHELTDPESETVDQHLRSCESCRTRYDAIRTQARSVQERLNALDPALAQTALDPALAYRHYRQKYDGAPQDRPALADRIAGAWKRPVWGWVAAASVLALLLSFAPGRTWAQKILAMMRVQKVAVVPVDLSPLTAETGNRGPAKLIAQLISDNVVVTIHPGKPALASTVQAAGEMAGFHVRSVEQLGTPQKIYVGDEAAFHMTLNRERIQAVLEQAGRSEIVIPESVDGSTVAVHIPKMVRIVYGGCSSEDTTAPATPVGSCIDFVQVPSPIVSVPPSLNIAALAEAGLQVTGMSVAEAHAFCQSVDWSSTLVIPIPQNGSSYRTVPVDGVNGTLVEMAPKGSFTGKYALIWVKNGIVYSLGGKGSADLALSAAASLN
ncbi:MAG: zf-HC2 domain-containing protein [Acidobacteriaceae bacterium]|nr:zf-HC2 domain-containing protein [Acidobacteriaceae bacterium]